MGCQPPDSSYLYQRDGSPPSTPPPARWQDAPGPLPPAAGHQHGVPAAPLTTPRAAAARRRRSGFAILALLTVLAVVASGVALNQRAAAVRQRDQAVYNQVIAEAVQFGTSDTPLAAQLNLAAYRIQPRKTSPHAC